VLLEGISFTKMNPQQQAAGNLPLWGIIFFLFAR